MRNPGSKEWARKLVAEYVGERPTKPTNVYRVAYQALGLEFPEGRHEVAPVASATPRQARPVPVPRRAPVEGAWWDTEPAAADSD
ncbi:hypothetical protein BC1002_6535 [Paraburkholderia atlantica]|uniref:Uncharacterized protein n=1 Tax=Paraburkholderia atlantica TaxID=2654982 RepID=D5WMD0_PARAM|nr:hypothetical protein [Paraburkholderia atlantica]ADG20376.1 hypothetical protein BC1002_6535 [Paraburkholderia atlantica]